MRVQQSKSAVTDSVAENKLPRTQVKLIFMHYVYVIKSRSNGKFYVGYTSNLKRRLEEHNSGEVFSTKPNLPYELVYFEGYRSKTDALKREEALKHHGQGFRRIKERIKESENFNLA